MNRFAVVVAAAGKSRRFLGASAFLATSAQKKPFVSLKGRAIWLYSAERFARRKDVAQVILVVSPEDRADVERRYAAEISLYGIDVVDGGDERFLSVENGFKAVKESVDFVAIHDAARPCLSDGDLENVFAEATRSRAAILATPIVGSIKRARGAAQTKPLDAEVVRAKLGFGAGSVERISIVESPPRANLWEAQTPQVFEKSLLERAFRERPKGFEPTDDAGLVEALGEEVAIVPGARTNIKITTSEDLAIAEKFLEIVARRDAKPTRFF